MSDQQPVPQTTPPPLPVATADLADSIQALANELAQDLQIELDGDTSKAVATAMQQIDMSETGSIIFFGSKAQQQLTTISDSMLEEVRTKDIGPAGNALNGMVSKLRELKFEDIDPSDKPNFLQRLFGMGNKLQEYLDQYETVREQIDEITGNLERHKTTLLTDITKLDKLYDANLDYFRTLEVYIAAGRGKLKELDDTTIPQRWPTPSRARTTSSRRRSSAICARHATISSAVCMICLLTRQVTMQSLPSIRLVQENDKSLITKINSTLANTVPLWRQQLAQAITIYRSGQAADAVEAATDLTNELLKNNADNLRQVNEKVREQVERGVFDIDTVREANDQLIATIEDSLRIADEGKAKRREAEKQLAECREPASRRPCRQPRPVRARSACNSPLQLPDQI